MGSRGSTRNSSQLLDGRRLEESYQRQLATGYFFNLHEQPDCQQRMAAQFEEIVPNSDPLDMEQLLPKLAKLPFQIRLRGSIAALLARTRIRARLKSAMDFCHFISFNRDGSATVEFLGDLLIRSRGAWSVERGAWSVPGDCRRQLLRGVGGLPTVLQLSGQAGRGTG